MTVLLAVFVAICFLRGDHAKLVGCAQVFHEHVPVEYARHRSPAFRPAAHGARSRALKVKSRPGRSRERGFAKLAAHPQSSGGWKPEPFTRVERSLLTGHGLGIGRWSGIVMPLIKTR